MGHTATPWVQMKSQLNSWIASKDTGEIVCDIGSMSPADRWEANADLILRAVNSHADLLAALELANELLDNSDVRHYIGHDLGEMSQLHKALNTARAAIAKAKGAL